MIKILALTDEENLDLMVKSLDGEMADNVFVINCADNIKYIYQEYQPDIILLDLQIPGMPGGEVLRYLALRDSVSAIVVLGKVQEKVIAEIIQLGESLGLSMVGVLTRPISPDGFKEMLHRYLGIKSGSK